MRRRADGLSEEFIIVDKLLLQKNKHRIEEVDKWITRDEVLLGILS
jgi:hypothetical protein